MIVDVQMQSTVGWEQLGLNSQLLRVVQQLGYTSPTAVQAETIPAILAGRDVIGSARTGSGKTAAFLLPILQNLLSRPPYPGTHVLVLSPTRELAVQTESMLQGLARGTRVRGFVVYGGVSLQAQRRALRGRIEIIVATPGRLLDHIRRGTIDLRDLDVLVLDEADRMLDMGFLPDVKQIISILPKRRQTLLFSATIPREVERLAREIMHDPVRFSVGRQDQPPETIRHTVYQVPDHLKSKLLAELIRRPEMKSVLVFTRTKWRADKLADELGQVGLKVGLIHGGKTQSMREAALAGFRAGRQRILVATDVAARGLDIQGITHIVNYDVPDTSTSYIHRVGRTARVEEAGEAISLVGPRESKDLKNIERDLGYSFSKERLSGFNYMERGAPRTEFRQRDQRPREFRPQGERPREFRPRDGSGSREFRPREAYRPREFRPEEGQRNDVRRDQGPETQSRGPSGEHRGYQRRKGKHRADWRIQGSRRGRY